MAEKQCFLRYCNGDYYKEGLLTYMPVLDKLKQQIIKGQD